MKRLCLALFMVAASALGQFTNFDTHATARAGHANGLPAAAFPTLCSSMAVTGNILYFAGTCWQTLATPADGTYSVTFTGGVPSYTAVGGGGAAFSAITSGTNTTAAMVVGTGGSLTTSGSGSITASAAPFSALTSATNSTAAMVVGTGGSLTTSGSGSITASAVAAGSVGTAGIAASAVTYAKIQNETNATILGNNSGGAAAPSELTTANIAALTATCQTSPTTCESMFDDFTANIAAVNTNPGEMNGWIVGNGAGAGSGIVAGSGVAVANHPGIAVLGTGTTGTTASCSVARGATSLPIILNGSEAMDWLVMIPVLSTTNDHFEVEVGIMLGGTTSALEATNGMFFEYTDSVNSGKWLFHSIKATAGSGTLDTTVAVVAGTWYHLKMIANSASSYQVIVNGTNAGNFTTAADIPIVALTPQIKIYCTNNTGASNKVVDLDYFWWLQTGLTR